MGCLNDPAWNVCGWGGVGGGVADTNYLYPIRWGWINKYTNLVSWMYINIPSPVR